MTSKFLRLFLAVAVVFAISAMAQTGSPSSSPAASTASPSASLPAAPSASASSTPPAITGTKVGAINIEGAIFTTNEGRRDMEALSKKFEPKQTELKGQNDELESLKKQLSTQQDKLNADALDTLKKQIESKQKLFDRAYQDFQEEAGSQQQDIANKILQKMAPMIVKYAQENGFGMIIDTSKPWPQSPVLIAGEGLDITKPVVDIYNAQSGVPAPSASGPASRPAAPRTGTGTGSKPPASTPPSAPKPQ
jgi:outer membrane protein